MDIGLKFCPFKDYWLNCYYNMVFSVLISLEPDYKLAAYMNNYSYDTFKDKTPNETEFSGLILRIKRMKFIDDFFSSRKPLDFKDEKNYSDFIKEKIRDKRVITIGVDLFYWVLNSICWDKYHWEHYSFINGYNDSKKVFYVFDENVNGYDEHQIPEERFYTAINNSSLEPHGYEYLLPDNIKKYKFSIDDVVDNAIELIKELKDINCDILWQFTDKDFKEGHMCDLNAMYIHQIINRHIANQLLYNRIYDVGIIDNIETLNTFVGYSQDLQKGWTLVKSKLIKAYYSKNPHSKIEEAKQKCNYLFEKECEMWDVFISHSKNIKKFS